MIHAWTANTVKLVIDSCFFLQAAGPKRKADGIMAMDIDGFRRLYKLISSRPETTSIFEQYI